MYSSVYSCVQLVIYCNGKGKVFYGQKPPIGESTTPECEVNYQLLAVIYGELLVAVDHNQLRTMASEMVHPIDRSHPPTLKGSTP